VNESPAAAVPAPTAPPRVESERAGTPPRPRRNRWQPLRVGLLDLFHYDYQEFWFRDGRLLWRGNNGTGKSKVLALTLPFLLDGEIAAHRVEPDGDQHKRMEWNLLLGGRYADRLGYTWIEFGRVDADGTEHYLTAGIALKAVAGRGIADRWFFVTDRRVGGDLPLVSPTGTVLTRDRLTEAIGDRGQVVRTAEHYRRLLDERLFHLGPDRFGALLDLLIQLRQPQLSKRPDPVLLSNALSEALTPLDPGLLADAAAGFRDLEQQRDELRSLKETHDDVRRFLTRYTRYAAVAARRQARELRTLHSHYEEAGRRLGEVRQLAEAASGEKEAAEKDLEKVRQRAEELRAVREQLTERPELHDLDRARTDAERAGHRAGSAAQRLAATRDKQERAAARLADARRSAQEAAGERDDALRATAAAAHEAASHQAHEHAVTAPGTLNDPAALRRALIGVADDRTAALDHLRGLARTAARAAALHTERLTRLASLEADRDAAADAVAEARDAVTLEGDRLISAWMGFAARTDAVPVPYPQEVGLPEWVADLDGPDPASAALDDRVQALRRDLARAEAEARARLVAAQDLLGSLAAQRAELEAGIPQSPPPPHTRDGDARRERDGAPLWRVVDVRQDTAARDAAGPLTDARRAGLEAALEASGLLDAWITPDGRALGADALDTVLVRSQPRHRGLTLADVLHATIDPDDRQSSTLDGATVTGVLRSVGVRETLDEAEDEDDEAVVCLDGGFRLGPLHGRWTKPAASYLGAAAREQARRRRLAELEAAMDEAEGDRSRAEGDLAGVAATEEALVAQLAERPSDQSLRDAHARAAAADTDHARREAALPPAREAVTAARATLAEAQDVLSTAASDLGLPADAAEHDRIATALSLYRSQATDLVAAVQRHADRLGDVSTWSVEFDAAEDALAGAAEDDATARAEARDSAARLRTLEQTLGDTVTELQAELERTLAELGRLTGEEKRLDALRTEAAVQLGQAQGREAELLEEQGTRQQNRDRSVVALRAFTATGLLAVAAGDLDIPDPATDWAADPAVRLARRVETALSEVDDSDQAWKRVQDDVTRRFGELTESLTRHGHAAHADLHEGMYVVSILYTGRERAPGELVGLIAAEVELRERELTSREQQVLEEHLVGDVASRLQELITEADALVGWMNAELAERPTSTGMTLRLAWQPDPDGPEGLAEARTHLLRQTSHLWSEADRRAVRDFLQRQIQRRRAEDPTGTWAEHLRRALDYRSWHRFVIERHQDGAWRSAVGPSSGGERVLTVSLPLFAAASAHYRSAHPHAPRLVLLDEAFAGVDDDARAKCLGLLTQFDLDVAMTSEREWGFYATVPGIATYQLVRHDGVDAVHVTAWEWDGALPRQVPRPVVLPQAPAPARPAGDRHGGDRDSGALF
jgi:uncharacterized protein (TIGR02680 family)